MRLLSTFLFSFLAFSSWAQIITFTGTLEGTQEAPPVTTSGTGVVGAIYDLSTKMLVVNANFANLSSNPAAAHIHQAPAGTNGDVLFNLAVCGTSASGTISGTSPLTPLQETELLNNGIYVNLHTVNHGGGELRAQLLQLDKVQNNVLVGVLSGLQEVPPVTTNGTGGASAIYNAETGELTVGATYQNLTSLPTSAHVHQGAIGVAGGVVFPLTFCGTAASGSLNGRAILSEAQAATLLNGGMYVNLHTVNHGGGELRAQLLLQQTQLVGKLEGTQEVPPVTTTGTGRVAAYYDHSDMSIDVRGTFENLMGQPTDAHIHEAPAGTGGGVIVGLFFSGTATSGTIFGSGTFNASQANNFLSGGTYVNLHTSAFGGGELRAQLGTATNALPLELLSFNVEKTKNGHQLTWTTASEMGIVGFDIEHQNAQKTFELLEEVAAKGTNRTLTAYSYSLPTLATGLHFFKLKIKEASGKTYYSDVVSITIDQSSDQIEMSIMPNPFGGQTTINFSIAQTQQVEVAIYNYAGVLVAIPYRQWTEAHQPIQIDFASKDLPSGLYYVQLKGNGLVTTQKIIKN